MMGGDLTGLLGAPDGPNSGFRQGVVVTFDPDNGQNTVAVAGGVLTDLPLVNTGAVIDIAAGDVVVLMRLRSSWAILGKIVNPGAEDYGVRAVEVQPLGWFGSGFALTTSYVTQAGTDLEAPEWANMAAVIAIGTISIWNTSGATRFVQAQTTISLDGALTAQSTGHFQSIANGQGGNAASSIIRLMVIDPGAAGVVAVAVDAKADAAVPAHASSWADVMALITFYRG